MSKRDRHLKQRLDELFSPPTEPAPAQPETTAGQPEVEPTGLAGSIGRAASAVDVSYLKTVIEQLPLPAYLKDREHTWVAVNAAFAQLNGHTPESLLGHTDKEQADDAWQLDDRVLDSGQQDLSEDTSAQPDGSIRTRRIRRTPLLNAQHKAEYVMGVVQDTFAAPPIQTQLQAAATIDENLFRDLFDNTDALIQGVTNDGAFVFTNRAWREALGYSEEELTRLNLFDVIHPDSQPHCTALFQRITEGAHIQQIEAKFVAKDGRTIDVAGSTSCSFKDGRPFITRGIFHDISERKHLEQELQKFRLGIERSTEAIFITDRDGTIVYVNPGFEKIYGYARDEALSQTPRILKSGLISAEGYKQFWETLLAKNTVAGEIVNKAKDGRLVTIEGSNIPILDEQGNILGFLAMHRDITQRKETEKALARHAAELEDTTSFLNSIFEYLPVALFMKDAEELRFMRWNKIMADLIGPTREEVMGKNDYDFFPPAEAEFFIAKDREVLSSGLMLDIPEEPIETKYQGQRLLHTRKVPLYAADGTPKYLLGISEDITDRRSAEAERERLLANVEHRAVQLQTASEVSNAASTILELDELLPFVVERIQQRFGLYYVGLFLIDEPQQHAILRAGTGEVGQRMLRGGHQLALDDHSMIGWCIQHQMPRIALDVGEDAVRFDNPNLPDTRSELALPLVSRGQVLGAMTVQSVQAAAFSEQDITILQTMSDQVATAIANAQLLEQASLARRQTETRLREMQFLRRVGQAVSSSLELSSVMDVVITTLEQELGFTHIALALMDKSARTVSILRAAGTAAALQGLTRSVDELHNDILLDVLNKGQIEVLDGWDDRFDREIYESQGHAALVRAFVPLQLRGESIGLLEVGYRRTERARITPEEVRLLGGLADQIAIALEHARLLQEAQAALADTRRLAEQGQVINRVLAAITSSFDMTYILDVIAGELAQALSLGHVGIAVLNATHSALTLVADRPFGPDGSNGVGIVLQLAGNPSAQQVIATRQSMVIPDAQTSPLTESIHEIMRQRGTQSLMILPLIIQNEVIGTVGLDILEAGRTFTPEEVRFAKTLVVQASIAIQNARLLEQAKDTARREQTLREITSRVRGSTDPDAIARTAIRELGLALGRQTFIRLGDAEQLSKAPQVSQEVLASGNGHKADGEGGR